MRTEKQVTLTIFQATLYTVQLDLSHPVESSATVVISHPVEKSYHPDESSARNKQRDQLDTSHSEFNNNFNSPCKELPASIPLNITRV